MLYALIVVVAVTVICLALARFPPFLQMAVLLTAVAGVCMTLLGVLMPHHDWEGKNLFVVLGSYCLWFIAPFLVVLRGSVSAQCAWGWALGLIGAGTLGTWCVSRQLDSPFYGREYVLLMGVASLFGWILACSAHSLKPQS